MKYYCLIKIKHIAMVMDYLKEHNYKIILMKRWTGKEPYYCFGIEADTHIIIPIYKDGKLVHDYPFSQSLLQFILNIKPFDEDRFKGFVLNAPNWDKSL